MPLLINRELITDDPWQGLADDEVIPVSGHVLLPFSRLAEVQTGIKPAALNLGLLINGDDDIQAVIAVIDRLKLVVVDIPAFTDGRGFSFARMLRRVGYAGEIRATGDVTRDRLAFLQRSGFNAFDIPDERYFPELDKAFTEISVHYQGVLSGCAQGAADDPKSVYRQKSEGK